jgi:hypothetical protein
LCLLRFVRIEFAKRQRRAEKPHKSLKFTVISVSANARRLGTFLTANARFKLRAKDHHLLGMLANEFLVNHFLNSTYMNGNEHKDLVLK